MSFVSFDFSVINSMSFDFFFSRDGGEKEKALKMAMMKTVGKSSVWNS